MNDLFDKYNTEMPSIGENIKKFRREKGLTQKQLALKCGMAEITIRQYETGKREPRFEQQKIICEKLEIPMVCLISGTTDDDVNTRFLAGVQDFLDTAKSLGVDRDVDKSLELIDLDVKWTFNYQKLNFEGRKKAVEHVEMLAKIPEYRKEEDSPDQDPEEE